MNNITEALNRVSSNLKTKRNEVQPGKVTRASPHEIYA